MDSFEKQYLVKEAAAIISFSPDTILRRIREKKLKAWKLPGNDNRRKRQYECWRIPASELLRFMKRNAA